MKDLKNKINIIQAYLKEFVAVFGTAGHRRPEIFIKPEWVSLFIFNNPRTFLHSPIKSKRKQTNGGKKGPEHNMQ